MTIYKATNLINDMSYIGYDSEWPRRMDEHKRMSETDKGYYFHNAIRKYGWENFSWEILLKDGTYDDEKRLIAEYATFGINGYNLSEGGCGNTGYRWTEDQKSSMSQIQRTKIKDGIHHFQSSKFQSNVNKQRAKNGTHNFTPEFNKNNQNRLLKNGTHHFLGSTNPVYKQIIEGTHPLANHKHEIRTCFVCNKTMTIGNCVRWKHGDTCKKKDRM